MGDVQGRSVSSHFRYAHCLAFVRYCKASDLLSRYREGSTDYVPHRRKTGHQPQGWYSQNLLMMGSAQETESIPLTERLLSRARSADTASQFSPLSDIPSSGIFRVVDSYRFPEPMKSGARSYSTRNISGSQLGTLTGESCRLGCSRALLKESI